MMSHYAPRHRHSQLAAALFVSLILAALAFVAGMDQGARQAQRSGTSTVTVDLARLRNSDCWYEVGQLDQDGKPGGRKIVNVEPLCP